MLQDIISHVAISARIIARNTGDRYQETKDTIKAAKEIDLDTAIELRKIEKRERRAARRARLARK